MPTPDPYDVQNADANIDAFTKEGRPDHVLRQLIRMQGDRSEAFKMLKRALDIAAAKGTDHLTDVCFTAMLEYSAGLLLRLHLSTERQMHQWDMNLANEGTYIPQELRNETLPAITKVHHHIMELTKAQASCKHLQDDGQVARVRPQIR